MYDYYEAVEDDVLEFIEEEGMTITEDNKDEIYDMLFNEDRITGNMSGSYTCLSTEARDYLNDNTDLILEMAEAFGYTIPEVGYKYLVEPEALDVMLRCYVLGSVIEKISQAKDKKGVFNGSSGKR